MHKSATRSVAKLVMGLLVVGASSGCAHQDVELVQEGRAWMRFDGTSVANGRSGIKCHRASVGASPWLIERRDRAWIGPDDYEDWWVWRANGSKLARTSLRLELTSSAEREASVQFEIDGAVYQSGPDTATSARPGWEDGRAVFTDVPLATGKPFKRKSQLGRLVVEWQCGVPTG